MQTLEAMRKRIQGAEDLHAVVRVMKALAAVSIRQYERAVGSLAQYSLTIEQGLQIVLRNRPEELSSGNKPPADQRWGAVLFGSDQGMCGSFNEQVVSLALGHLDTDSTNLVVGTRVATRLEDAGHTIDALFPVPSSVAGITPIVHDLVMKIEQLRFERGIERFVLFHNRSIAGSIVRAQKLALLPVDREWLRGLEKKHWLPRTLPTFTMNWRQLFSSNTSLLRSIARLPNRSRMKTRAGLLPCSPLNGTSKRIALHSTLDIMRIASNRLWKNCSILWQALKSLPKNQESMGWCDLYGRMRGR